MLNKFVITLVLVFLAFFLYSVWDNQNPSAEMDSIGIEIPVENEDSSVQIYDTSDIRHKDAPRNPKDIPEVTTNGGSKDDSLSEQQLVYDPDPVVDASYMLHKHALCYSYVKTKNSAQSRVNLERIKFKMNPQQEAYFSSYYDYCVGLQQNHPELRIKDIGAVRKQIANADASSLWGQILNSDVDAESLPESEIVSLLKQNDPVILALAPFKLKHYYEEVIHWDLEYVLQSHQYDYVRIIQEYAHQYYLCGLGEDCSAHSSFMAKMCFMSSDACGLDFHNFIEELLTPGQKNDLQIAVKYFTSRYQ